MTAKIKQIHPVFVGEVSDVDLRKPLSTEDVRIIDEGMAKFGVLIFHGQNISDEQQTAFSRNFGELELPGMPGSSNSPKFRLNAVCCSSLIFCPWNMSTPNFAIPSSIIRTSSVLNGFRRSTSLTSPTKTG